MQRSYSLFVTDDSLLASPHVRKYNYLHDLTIQLNQKETVNFLIQTPLTSEQKRQLRIDFDQHMVEIHRFTIHSYRHQTLVRITLTAKELGIVRLGFAYPTPKPNPLLRSLARRRLFST